MKIGISAAVVLLVSFSAEAVKNKDWYVSNDMQYGSEIEPKNCTNDLQYAVSNCTEGYTVWVKDGFVCDKGEAFGNHVTNRIRVTSAITVRSESGYVDEAKGKGATIRGAHDPSTATGYGSKGIRCVELANNSKLIGFILENGGNDNISYTGGGVLGRGGSVLSNCVVRNCRAQYTGAIGSVGKNYNTVVTNNFGGRALYNTAYVSGCTIRGNSTGPAIRYYQKYNDSCVITNTEIACNTDDGFGVGVSAGQSANVSLWCCFVTNNVTCVSSSAKSGGALAGELGAPIKVHHCTIAGNVSTQVLGGAAYACDLDDCQITDNIVTDGNGGGLHSCTATRCTIARNQCVRISGGGTGGGAVSCILSNCTVVANEAYLQGYASGWAGYAGGTSGGTNVNCTIAGNKASCRGGGANGGVFYNCIVTNNTAVNKGGGGIWNGSCYNTLIAYNTAGGAAGLACDNDWPAGCAINCTFTGNKVSSSDGAGFSGVPLVVNSISWANTCSSGVNVDKCAVCSNSCVASLSATTSYGIISRDPRLDANYAPRAHGCHNTGIVFDWMTDADDVRAKDVYGNARVRGTGPDMGAVETPDYGLMLLVR